MNIVKFSLLEDQERDTIVHEETGLKVVVFDLGTEDYRPAEKEYHLFGDDHGDWLAFETVVWKGQPLDLLHKAVSWYAALCLDYPEMIILDNDARPAFKLRKR